MRQVCSAATLALVLATGAAMAQNAPGRAQSQVRDPTPGSAAPSKPLGQSNPLRGENTDQEFVRKAVDAGMAEVQMGKLAAEKARNEQVRQFGHRMVDDHTRASNELLALLQRKNVEPPEQELDPEHAGMRDRLRNVSPTDFDRVYMQSQVKDHLKAIELFKGEAKHGQDRDLKQFASKTLPTLREHLKMAQSVAAQTTPQAATPPVYSKPSTWAQGRDASQHDERAATEELNREHLKQRNENPAVQR